MREKNDEKSRKSGYSGFSVSVVRIMSGYFHNLFPRPSHTKWSIPKFINVFQTCPRSNSLYEIDGSFLVTYLKNCLFGR